MHSRVFVLATEREIINGDYLIPDGEDVVKAIPLADYVGDISTGEEMKEDIKWFKEYYGDETISKKEVFTTIDENKVIGYKINVEAFKKALEKIFDEILERVKEELRRKTNAKGVDKALIIDNINYITNAGGFHFGLSDGSIVNETFLYIILEGTLKNKDLYIIATIDYHM